LTGDGTVADVSVSRSSFWIVVPAPSRPPSSDPDGAATVDAGKKSLARYEDHHERHYRIESGGHQPGRSAADHAAACILDGVRLGILNNSKPNRCRSRSEWLNCSPSSTGSAASSLSRSRARPWAPGSSIYAREVEAVITAIGD
jgi:hypothetical protein